MRVLDVARTFAARPWTEDGDVVLDVADAQGHVVRPLPGRHPRRHRRGVRHRRRRRPRRSTPRRSGRSTLGGVDVTTLHAAGRVAGEEQAVARFAAMADLADEPYNILGF